MVDWVIVLALHSTSSPDNQSEMCVHNLTHSTQQKTNSTRLTNVWKAFSQMDFTSHAPDSITCVAADLRDSGPRADQTPGEYCNHAY